MTVPENVSGLDRVAALGAALVGARTADERRRAEEALRAAVVAMAAGTDRGAALVLALAAVETDEGREAALLEEAYARAVQEGNEPCALTAALAGTSLALEAGQEPRAREWLARAHRWRRAGDAEQRAELDRLDRRLPAPDPGLDWRLPGD